MGRRIRELVGPAELPGPCRSCVFWEVAGAPQGATGDGAAAKEAWWRATELEWGVPGKGVFVDDELVAYVTYGPPGHFPRARTAGKAPSDDALVIATLWVAPPHRGGGIAKTLVQVALREATRRGLEAVEAVGVRIDDPSAWRCVVPVTFLQSHGFAVLHDDPIHPLLRLDLGQTVRWREQVGSALETVVSALSRRERLPQPAPDTGVARSRRNPGPAGS